ncbi:MAG TPA: DUF1328 domain-containing protein [Gammaproteobacteria bacterium]|jgi:uncharacterized membrane protein YtjA (UPF0391 family)
MLYWALIFLVIALIAGALGFSGIAGTATSMAWILFVVGLVVALVFFLRGRRPPLA